MRAYIRLRKHQGGSGLHVGTCGKVRLSLTALQEGGQRREAQQVASLRPGGSSNVRSTINLEEGRAGRPGCSPQQSLLQASWKPTAAGESGGTNPFCPPQLPLKEGRSQRH